MTTSRDYEVLITQWITYLSGVEWYIWLTNLTANRLRPSPQDTYRYGKINITRTIRLASSARQIKGNQRYALNRASFYPSDTPLKLADFQN
ncbi:hypothetical protein YC2023_083894 [Brassica napus]